MMIDDLLKTALGKVHVLNCALPPYLFTKRVPQSCALNKAPLLLHSMKLFSALLKPQQYWRRRWYSVNDPRSVVKLKQYSEDPLARLSFSHQRRDSHTYQYQQCCYL